MRKWIFIGVVGGLLQFAAVSYVAFSGSGDDPIPAKHKAPEPEGRSKRANINRPQRTDSTGTDSIESARSVKAQSVLTGRTLANETVQPVSPAPPVPVPAPAPDPAPAASADPPAAGAVEQPLPAVAIPADLSLLPVEEMIREVFKEDGDKAVEVAKCESELETSAENGLFLGLFQLGHNERAEYGHGEDALAQVQAAHELFLVRGWQPWVCA